MCACMMSVDLTGMTSSRRSTSVDTTTATAAAETRDRLEQSFDDSLIDTDTQTAPSVEHCHTPVNDTATSVYFHRDVVTYLIPKLTDQVVLPRRAWFCPIPNASFQSVVTSQYTSYIRLFITVGLYSEPVNHQP